jgi:4-hydroxythreonine-4-phosphate dehydrogenase
MTIPRIGISLGDPGGIGPEVLAKALGGSFALPAAKYVLFGNVLVLKDAERILGSSLGVRYRRGAGNEPGIYLQSVKTPLRKIVRGAPSPENGKASFLFFKEAVAQAQKKEIDALVTAPISKASWRMGGIVWRGHTEYLEHLHPGAIMTFWSEKIRVALFSHHLPLSEAVSRVKKGALVEFFRMLHQGLGKRLPGKVEFLVSGLNPHAGENGLLGWEEEKEIVPAVKEARSAGIRISGPYPPDTVFLQALDRPDRIVVALYHDQGLIGFKLAAFESGVNTTVGMPFIRTSPDHGTAFDIAGRGIADPRSMVEALKLAVELSSCL